LSSTGSTRISSILAETRIVLNQLLLLHFHKNHIELVTRLKTVPLMAAVILAGIFLNTWNRIAEEAGRNASPQAG